AHAMESRSVQPAAVLGRRGSESTKYGASFSRNPGDRELLATCGTSGVWLWNRRTGEELAHLDCGNTRQVLFRADGRGLVANSTIGGLYYWPIRREFVHGADL